MNSWRRLLAIVVKEVRQLRRDRLTLGMIVGIPVLQLLLFGYAINLDLRGLSAAIADQAGTAGSRALAQDLLASDVIHLQASASDAQEIEALLRTGQISVGILIPPDFERRRIDGRPLLQVIVDGSDNTVLQAARQIAQVPVTDSPGLARVEPAISVLPLYNPQRRSAVFIVPALIGVILTMTMVMFTAVAIVRESERGNLELLITTPVSRLELMLGKVLPYMVIGLLQTTVVLTLGVLLFEVPIRGALWQVYIAALLLIVANLGLGLLISTRAQTQFQAMQMAFFVFLPSILLSGFMFPFAGMPRLAQWIAEVLPLTHFLRLIRGVMLRGASIFELQADLWALLLFTAVMLTASVLRFRKRLD